MIRKYIHSLSIGIMGLLIVSCSKSNESEPSVPTEAEYRVSWIHSGNNSIQLFDYNTSGRISEWKYEESSLLCRSTYEYCDEEGMIEICSEEKRGDDIWKFNERLSLDQNGTATHAAGKMTISKEDGSLLMMKNYSVGFQYNPLNQLTKVNIVERRTDDTGREEPSGLEWSIELEWNDNNLTKYTEYSTNNKPSFSKTFTYYEGETAHYIPIVSGTILRYYYLPLQYQGVLGLHSPNLVKEINYGNSSSKFSYNIATSIHSSYIVEYSELFNGKEIKYTIGWDNEPKPPDFIIGTPKLETGW